MHVRALERFAKWFASPGGVLQTAVVTAVIIAVENIWHGLDPHGFWLLYWLTAYSAVTQPVLAFVNRQDTTHGESLLKEILDDTEEITHLSTPSKEN